MINLTNQTVLAKWFVRLRGRALAYGNLGQRLGQGAVPVMAQLIITGAGWRWAAASLGVFAWGLTLIPVLLWMRRQPEDMGLRPDGDPPVREGAAAAAEDRERRPPTSEIHFTLREALRTRTFYILLAVLCITELRQHGHQLQLHPVHERPGTDGGRGGHRHHGVVAHRHPVGAGGGAAGGADSRAGRCSAGFSLGWRWER